ncbi:transmembrane protein, putative [Medicago truncatula]|uniref:Transmembrane protein, putative n=1 Tax=Medicago truncatula TaxID=3880 RepID=G7K7L3_MEDTR|nr:transmembrane protein, putative [Medicago truncatula]
MSLYLDSNSFEGVITVLVYLNLSSNSLTLKLSENWVPPFQLYTLYLSLLAFERIFTFKYKYNTPSGLECKKQNKKIVGLKCKQKYTKVILLNVTIPILTSFTLSNLFHIPMFNAFQRFFIGGVQKSYFQDKGITGKMGQNKLEARDGTKTEIFVPHQTTAQLSCLKHQNSISSPKKNIK